MKNLMEMMKNEEFVKKVAMAENADQLEKIFNEEGLELESGLSYEQAFSIIHHAAEEDLTDEEKKMIESYDADELNENDLEGVAGGLTIGAAIGAAALCYLGYKYIKGCLRALRDRFAL